MQNDLIKGGGTLGAGDAKVCTQNFDLLGTIHERHRPKRGGREGDHKKAMWGDGGGTLF